MRVMKVPKSEYRSFSVDPRRFLRDILNISGKAEEPFILHPDRIRKCFNYGIINPFDEINLSFDIDFKCVNPDKPRFMHIDLAQNKCGAGISMTHMSHVEEISNREGKMERHPFIQFDFLGSIRAERGSEVEIRDVEDIIYKLTGLGFNIALITFDRFQSVYIRQRLVEHGYVAAQMSVERCSNKIVLTAPTETNRDCFKKESTNQQILSAFNSFKSAAYMGLLAIPYHELAFNEIIKAGLLKDKNKIVPLPGMSIDILHSMAGSVFNLMNNTVIVGIGGEESDVWKDGFYDRYRQESERDIRDGSSPAKVDAPDGFYDPGFYEINDNYYRY